MRKVKQGFSTKTLKLAKYNMVFANKSFVLMQKMAVSFMSSNALKNKLFKLAILKSALRTPIETSFNPLTFRIEVFHLLPEYDCLPLPVKIAK